MSGQILRSAAILPGPTRAEVEHVFLPFFLNRGD